jgi:putative CocE/NonD family hydrolase
MTPKPGKTRYGRLMQNVKIPMRDGILLEATVALPEGDGPFPAVLVRTAYSRTGQFGADFTKRGMAFVIQDCRGRYGSGGDWYPFTSEANDGFDTLKWMGEQPWCNGKIGMFGPSYLAIVQLYVAPTGSPYLAALSPQFMSGDLWRQGYYCDGVFSLALTFSWLCLEVGSRTSSAGLLPAFNVEALLRELPLLTLDEKCGCGPVPAYRDYVSHDCRDAFWEALSVRETMDRFTVPVLLTGGWYDYYANETFANYRSLVASAPSRALAESHRVIVGPWTHGFGGSKLGQLDFGPDATKENDSTVRWLDCILKGRDARSFQEAPIRIFVMGANQWRDEREWPPARARFVKFFLHSGGRANSLLGNGLLSRELPGDESPDRYTYDPEYPVPTLGGNHSVGPYNPGLYELALPGPYDQRPVERRDDVLVYTTEELEEDLEVTGPVSVKLFAATSARDTDFVARLCDVCLDGRSINITEGVIRARFRGGNWKTPKLVEPGKVLEYDIELQPTSNVFKKGHRMRLDITSSNFPLWSRNPNTGYPPATDTEMQPADQTVYHGPGQASYVLLPVVSGVSFR